MLEDFQVNDFKIISQIGSGVYGLVFHVYDVVTNFEFAMKVISKSSINSQLDTYSKEESEERNLFLQKELFDFFQNNHYNVNIPAVDLQSIKDLTPEQLCKIPQYHEIWMQLKVHSHKNIVTIHQVFESPVATFVIMEYYPVDLFNSIVNQKKFESNGLLIKEVFLQICSALQYCHSLGIYHCDVKPENILIDKYNNAYLCDFGLSTTTRHLAPNTCVGSTYYIAPEKILYYDESVSNFKKLPTDSGDVWSLGILLINLTCTRNPWLKAHQTEDRAFHHYVKDSKILQKILPLSDELYGLLLQVLQINPYKRISIEKLMNEFRSISSFTKEGPLKFVAGFNDDFGTANVVDSRSDSYEYTTNKQENISLYKYQKSGSSCSTLNNKFVEGQTDLKNNINLNDYIVIPSETTVCGSDLGSYSAMFNDTSAEESVNDSNNLRVDISSS